MANLPKSYRVQDGCWNCQDGWIYECDGVEIIRCVFGTTKPKEIPKANHTPGQRFPEVTHVSICSRYKKKEVGNE